MVPESEVFSRERLAGYDPEVMRRSVALVVGAGALGQNTAQDLALAGLGEIRLVDRDRFEEHNRTRSPAYPLPEEQALYGLDKARAVAYKLRRLMTAPRPVMRYAQAWIQELGDGAFDGVSVIISCVDSQIARAYLSDKARQHGLPYVEAGFHAADTTLTSFPAFAADEARDAPCWRCSHPNLGSSFSCRFYAAQAEASGVIPAVQNTAAVLGGLQAEAAILALHPALTESNEARCLALNVRTWKAGSVKLSRDPKCEGMHSRLDSVPIALKTRATDTVEHLLIEMSEYFGRSARLKFPLELFAKLVWQAPCTGKGCENMADVREPEWRWRMNPLCEECGGPFPVLVGESLGSAFVYEELSMESKPEILGATCEQIGLAPLSLVEGIVEGSASAHFKMAGSLAELFEPGDAYER
jgi:molybdopterin/thiamine biosynthesis adenylyltransferase